MVNAGSLDKYKHQDLTPVIGREFEGLQVTELLTADEQLIKDLAVTISERGVIFLRDQDVTPQQMKELMERMTEAAGCVCSASSLPQITSEADDWLLARVFRAPYSPLDRSW